MRHTGRGGLFLYDLKTPGFRPVKQRFQCFRFAAVIPARERIAAAAAIRPASKVCGASCLGVKFSVHGGGCVCEGVRDREPGEDIVVAAEFNGVVRPDGGFAVFQRLTRRVGHGAGCERDDAVRRADRDRVDVVVRGIHGKGREIVVGRAASAGGKVDLRAEVFGVLGNSFHFDRGGAVKGSGHFAVPDCGGDDVQRIVVHIVGVLRGGSVCQIFVLGRAVVPDAGDGRAVQIADGFRVPCDIGIGPDVIKVDKSDLVPVRGGEDHGIDRLVGRGLSFEEIQLDVAPVRARGKGNGDRSLLFRLDVEIAEDRGAAVERQIDIACGRLGKDIVGIRGRFVQGEPSLEVRFGDLPAALRRNGHFAVVPDFGSAERGQRGEIVHLDRPDHAFVARAVVLSDRSRVAVRVGAAGDAGVPVRQSGSESESLPAGEDGVFEGQGVGFGGEIAVTVTVDGGRIAAVDVLSADGEDPAYFAEAEGVTDRILAEQSMEVDTVSGATFSSRGILEAVRNALETGKGGRSQ